MSRSVIVLQLGIQDHGIPFLDIRLTVGDDRAVFAADHYDQLLTRDVQILDLLSIMIHLLFTSLQI